MLLTKINYLLVLALPETPNMQLMTVAAVQQMLGLQPLFNSVRSSPLAAN